MGAFGVRLMGLPVEIGKSIRGGGVFLGCVHIRCCGNGGLGFRSYSGSLLERPKSNQKAFAPTLGTSLRLGVPSLRLESVGNPAGRPRIQACVRPACLTGRSEIKSQSAAALEPTDSLCRSRFKMWELACLRCRQLGTSGKPSRCHRRQASSHRGPRTLYRSGRLSGRLALLLILILGAPTNRNQTAESVTQYPLKCSVATTG
jgi:hypothetical protein